MRNHSLKFLSDEEMNTIHDASLDLLEKTGMKIDHPKALDLLHDAGAEVDIRSKIAKFPKDLITKHMNECPKELLHAGRDTDQDILVKAATEEIFGRSAVGPLNYQDFETGIYRRITSNDIKKMCVLIDALPNIITAGGLFAEDFPAHTADVHCAQYMFKFQRKHLVLQSFTAKQLKYVIEMALVIRGDKEHLKQRPLFTANTGIISPLYISKEDMEMMMLACEYSVPSAFTTQPIAGATGPITLGGNLVIGNAELIGTITLCQLMNPGHNFLCAFIPGITEMTTGTPLFGSLENIIMAGCLTQMGELFYGVPTAQGAGEVDGVIFEQTQTQRIQKMLSGALSGGSMITNLGMIDAANGISPTQLVIDNENVDMIRLMCQSLEINADTLALDAIHRVGPQGHFLADEHTLEHLKSSTLFRPQIYDRDVYDIWVSKGSKNWEIKAKEKVLDILSRHSVPPLDEKMINEIDKIANKSDSELA